MSLDLVTTVSRDYQESVYTHLRQVVSRAAPKPKSRLTFSGNVTGVPPIIGSTGVVLVVIIINMF